ncbi:MAG: DUF4184 family protein [Planctomycetota bacterium]
MNTTAHVAASLFLGKSKEESASPTALITGAIVPDAPMFVFFGIVTAAGHSGKEIWGELYFREGWQLFFDIFNSAPLFALLWAIGQWRNWPWLTWMSISALLHIACDLPLHHDDSHRHFLPFSQFRFASPVSYWDPKHWGIPVAILEATLTIAGSAYLVARSASKLVRISAIIILALYALASCMLIIWVLGLR